MNMREKIARAINPSAFNENWQGLYFFKAWQDEARAKALSQADAALDALMEPTEGMKEFGVTVMIADWQDIPQVRTIFQALIRAAKEGK